MVGALLDLIGNIIFLVTEPLSMISLLWQLCMRFVCFLTLPWFGLFKFMFGLYLDICWRLISWGVSAISIPIRLLTALQGEKVLEARLYELQTQLEGLIWVNKDLEQRLEVAIKTQKKTEIFLAEAEEEQDGAIEKLQLLEIRIREIEAENLKLREIEKRALLEAEEGKNAKESKKIDNGHVTEHSLLRGGDGIGSDAEDKEWNSVFEKRGKILGDYLMGKGRRVHGSKMEIEELDPFLESRMTSSGDFSFPSDSFAEKQKAKPEIIYEWKGVALVQSTFSAFLSLLVGMIAWEAQDPCIPLVIALFIVVGISLKSVVQYFSRIQNRPGSDAIALLSFNWFILGTLASPTLPNIARSLIPLVSGIGCRLARWFGFSLV